MPEIVPPSLLDRGVVLSCLPARAADLLGELNVQAVIDSTNAEAWRRTAAGAESGLVRVAEQRAGVGAAANGLIPSPLISICPWW